MGILKAVLGVLSPISVNFLIARRGTFVGEDQFGNRYYRGAPMKGYNHERRWVRYAGDDDASNIPPEWHGWMHHQTDSVPVNEALSYRKPWQRAYQPNRTGTALAYRPPGHQLMGGQRAPATGDYDAWKPE